MLGKGFLSIFLVLSAAYRSPFVYHVNFVSIMESEYGPFSYIISYAVQIELIVKFSVRN